MPREKKFNFVHILPNEARVRKEEKPTVSVSSTGQVSVSAAALHQYNLRNCLVDVLVDVEKKAFALRKLNGQSLPQMTKTMRLLKPSPTNGQVKFSIGKLLNQIGAEKKSYNKLEVKKYIDIMERHELYYFELK